MRKEDHTEALLWQRRIRDDEQSWSFYSIKVQISMPVVVLSVMRYKPLWRIIKWTLWSCSYLEGVKTNITEELLMSVGETWSKTFVDRLRHFDPKMWIQHWIQNYRKQLNNKPRYQKSSLI
jgi:hypothetical protein